MSMHISLTFCPYSTHIVITYCKRKKKRNFMCNPRCRECVLFTIIYLDERFDVYSLEVNIIKENIVQVSKANKRSDEQLNIQ